MIWMYVGFIALVLFLLALDLGVFHRKAHVVSVKEALGTGTASGFLFDAYLTRMVEPGGAVSFTLAMLRKDVTLARAEAASQGLDCAFLDDALAAIDRACARHGGEAGVQFLAQDGRAGGA